MGMKKANFIQLAFMLYGFVCAGAYGLEPMVSESGPGVALTVLFFMPFLFSIPIALVSAELTSAYPHEGGSYGWVRRALGEFWGFQAGWWTWLSLLVALTSFIVLFNEYLAEWIPSITVGEKYLLALLLVWGLTVLNFFGIRVVGNASIGFGLVFLLPFFVTLIFGIFEWNQNPLVPFINPNVAPTSAWLTSLAWGVWLYSGYERLSVSSDEVESPEKSFPRALFIVAVLVAASYFLPTLVALASAANPDEWNEWSDGFFVTIADRYHLGWMMVIGGLVSNIAISNIHILANSRYLAVMSKSGTIPGGFHSVNKRFGTPLKALVFCSLIYSFFALYSFEELIYAYAWTCVGSYILLYVTAFVLRKKSQNTSNSYTIPVSKHMLLLLGLPTIVIGVIGGLIDIEKSRYGLLLLLSGPVLFFVLKLFKR